MDGSWKVLGCGWRWGCGWCGFGIECELDEGNVFVGFYVVVDFEVVGE